MYKSITQIGNVLAITGDFHTPNSIVEAYVYIGILYHQSPAQYILDG